MKFKKAETLFVEGGGKDDDGVDNARRRPTSTSTPKKTTPPQSFAPSLDASNPGFSMLRSMGWSESNPGLGKANQGRSEPVRAEPRRARAGLGAEKQKPEAAAAPLPGQNQNLGCSRHRRPRRRCHVHCRRSRRGAAHIARPLLLRSTRGCAP